MRQSMRSLSSPPYFYGLIFPGSSDCEFGLEAPAAPPRDAGEGWRNVRVFPRTWETTLSIARKSGVRPPVRSHVILAPLLLMMVSLLAGPGPTVKRKILGSN
jgi:hypothetical protein